MTITPILIVSILLLAKPAFAHCPLCTAGAGVAAVGAAWLGVGTAPIGVFIGAFAVALGFWFGNIIKKKFIPYQKSVLTLLSFGATVFPILSLMPGFFPVYISFAGDYGTILNRTYLINWFLIGSIIGGLIMVLAPFISRKITSLRNGKTYPYQGLGVTFGALLVVTLVLQLWIY